MAVGGPVSPDPARLLRLTGPVAGYPLEPSNEELAAIAGLPVEAIVRYDMNTLGDGPLPAVREAWRQWDPASRRRIRGPRLPPSAGRDRCACRRCAAARHPGLRRR